MTPEEYYELTAEERLDVSAEDVAEIEAEIDQHYAAMQDSVVVINAMVAEAAPYLDTAERLRANVDHLTQMRSKDFWTTEDFTDVDAAIANGEARIAEVEASGMTRPPSASAVNAERDRRIAAGFDWNGKTFQSDRDSRENIAGAATSAVSFIVSGGSPDEVYWQSPDTPFVWLATDNTEVQMTPEQVIDFGNAAMAHKKAHIFAARTLKDMAEIPQDFTADKYWP